jgi:hypothetical protein
VRIYFPIVFKLLAHRDFDTSKPEYENQIKVLFAESIELAAENTSFLREEINTLMYVVAFYMAEKGVCFN